LFLSLTKHNTMETAGWLALTERGEGGWWRKVSFMRLSLLSLEKTISLFLLC